MERTNPMMRQQPNLLLAADGGWERLATAEKARLLVVSDSHGSRETIAAILRRFGREADALCFCGDGADDLLALLSDGTRPELAGSIPPVVAMVQGNGDNSTGTLVTEERIFVHIPVQIEFTAARRRVMMTHGHRYNVYMGTKALRDEAELVGADIAFYGHTHVANAQAVKCPPYLLNPGSCARPRGGLPHTFAVVDLSEDKPLPDYRYYEIAWNVDGDIEFRDYEPPTVEFSMLW